MPKQPGSLWHRRAAPRLARAGFSLTHARALSLGLGLASLFCAAEASSAPPSDDWSIETRKDDSALVSQRFAKLRRQPFDTKQFRALQKALGKRGLAAKIRAAADRAPSDDSLQILLARVELDQSQPRAAAARLGPIAQRNSRLAGRAFALQIDALSAAAQHAEAVTLLEARAKTSADDAKTKLLTRAFELAQRGGLDADALRLAKTLAKHSPDDSGAQLRLARAATAAGDASIADAAYAKAAASARGARRDELTAQRAQARASAKDLAGADALLWDLLKDSKRGRKGERGRWWEMLIEVHRLDASGEVLAARVQTWLGRDGHGQDADAWKALAAAQTAAGLDPVAAWKKAIEINGKDTQSRAALIASLESEGESEAALAQYRALRGHGPQEVQLGLEMARRLITNGERETGMHIVREIEARAGRDANTLLLLLDFYNSEGEHMMALTIAKRLVAVKGRDPEARIALGEQLFEMGRRDEAVKQWAMLPKLVRPQHAGHFRHAEILSGHSRNDRTMAKRAREEIAKAIKMRPQEPSYLRLRASLVTEANTRNAEAIDAWQAVRVAALAPAQSLLREEARTRLVELVSNRSRSCRSCAARRDTLLREAHADLDGDNSERALEGGLFLAALAAAQNDWPTVVTVQRDLLGLYPENPERYVALARAHERTLNYDKAIEVLEQGLELDSSRNVELLTKLSEIAFASGDEGAARIAAERAAKLGSDGALALLRLGQAHQRRGDLKSAEAAFRATLQAAPRNADARTALADLQLNRGDLAGAAETYRALLEAGGNPELMRVAGRRALDLGEASGSLTKIMGLAVRRTKREPEAEEPREFLLDTLDRVGRAQVEAWLRDRQSSAAHSDAPPPASAPPRIASREAALRRALLSGLNRGSIRVRLRAAQQLGELHLPDTAEALARVGARLSPPRDASSAVRAAFGRVRAVAILSAGKVGDAKAADPLVEVLKRGSRETREAAAWSLAKIGSPAALKALRQLLNQVSGDEQARALACLGLARHSSGRDRVTDLHLIRESLGRLSELTPKAVCTAATAALTPAGGRAGLLSALREGSPQSSAIAAWRLGQIAGSDDEIFTALFEAFLGPAGRRRDAAALALSVRLNASKEPADFVMPSPPNTRTAWGATLNRWLDAQVSKRPAPVPAELLRAQAANIRHALDRLEQGTRAEQGAGARANRCLDAAQTPCFAPLSDELISVASR